MAELIHIARGVQKNCYALMWSYGEICVGCNCCGKSNNDRLEVLRAKLNYHRELLQECNEFSDWIEDNPKLKMAQAINNNLQKQEHIEKIKDLSHEFTEIKKQRAIIERCKIDVK